MNLIITHQIKLVEDVGQFGGLVEDDGGESKIRGSCGSEIACKAVSSGPQEGAIGRAKVCGS